MFVIVNSSRTCKCMIWYIMIHLWTMRSNWYILFFCDQCGSGKMSVSFCCAFKRETFIVQEFDWHFFLMSFLCISSLCISLPKIIIWRNYPNLYDGVSVFDVCWQIQETICIYNNFCDQTAMAVMSLFKHVLQTVWLYSKTCYGWSELVIIDS